jgi:hypothetical protein
VEKWNSGRVEEWKGGKRCCELKEKKLQVAS